MSKAWLVSESLECDILSAAHGHLMASKHAVAATVYKLMGFVSSQISIKAVSRDKNPYGERKKEGKERKKERKNKKLTTTNKQTTATTTAIPKHTYTHPLLSSATHAPSV